MKKKYRNRLPKDAEVKGYIAHVENGEIIVEVELKDRFQPKDGDFCVSSLGNVFIYCVKELLSSDLYCGCYCVFCSEEGQIITCYTKLHTKKDGCRYATPEEKDDFLKRLETEERLRWNADTKKLEPIRWRAERNGIYWFIDPHGWGNRTVDIRSNYDNDMYEIGNYFRTPEAAQKVADQIKDIFKNAKAE